MVRHRLAISRIAAGAAAFLLAVPVLSSAQTGIIAGVVKDTTGAVLPGATVEASSDALIEKVRTAATEGQGQYKTVDLRPGIYKPTTRRSSTAGASSVTTGKSRAGCSTR